MMRALLVLLAVVGATGCAPMLYAPGGMVPPHGLFAPAARPAVGPDSPWTSVVGRWDNVVGLKANALVGIVTADGTLRAGRFVRAGSGFVRVLESGVEVELPRADVARLDLLKSGEGIDGGGVVRDAARGAHRRPDDGGALPDHLRTPTVIRGDPAHARKRRRPGPCHTEAPGCARYQAMAAPGLARTRARAARTLPRARAAGTLPLQAVSNSQWSRALHRSPTRVANRS